MTETELLAAVVQEALAAEKKNPEGFYTRTEWEDILGMGEWATMKRLKALDRAGRIEFGEKAVTRFGGKGTQTVQAYRFVPEQ